MYLLFYLYLLTEMVKKTSHYAQVAQIEHNSKEYTRLETWWIVYSCYEYMIPKRRANSVVQFSKKNAKNDIFAYYSLRLQHFSNKKIYHD